MLLNLAGMLRDEWRGHGEGRLKAKRAEREVRQEDPLKKGWQCTHRLSGKRRRSNPLPVFSLFCIIFLFHQIGVQIWLTPQGPPKPPSAGRGEGSSREPDASVTQGFQNICPVSLGKATATRPACGTVDKTETQTETLTTARQSHPNRSIPMDEHLSHSDPLPWMWVELASTWPAIDGLLSFFPPLPLSFPPSTIPSLPPLPSGPCPSTSRSRSEW